VSFWPGDWRHRARCRDIDGDLFSPDGHSPIHNAQVEAAKAICAPCPVRPDCLEWALDTGQHHGIWGGLDATERHHLGRRRTGKAS
jgi:WhiB family transcriptional regulator, redox-sensing transcriptional regulator